MKKLLLILLCLPFIGFGQLTYVPDNNFEAYLENNGMGNGIANDDSVTTAIINGVTQLFANGCNISDLTGIEDFLDLEILECGGNQLTSLDLDNNNQLIHLACSHNQLISLDVSNNTALTYLRCYSNQLISLDVRNGNNHNSLVGSFWAHDNPNLYCINVDDSTWSVNNWPNGIDTQSYFSNDCSGITDIKEHTTNKELLKVTDLLGRETKPKTNTPFIEIYDDGTVEKRIVIE